MFRPLQGAIPATGSHGKQRTPGRSILGLARVHSAVRMIYLRTSEPSRRRPITDIAIELIEFGQALAAFAFGVFFAGLFSYAVGRLFKSRAMRRFVRFVQPESANVRALPPVASTEDVGLAIHRTLRLLDEDCEKKSLRQLPHLGRKQQVAMK